MRDKSWNDFMKTGKINDYLKFKKQSKKEVEFSSQNQVNGDGNEKKSGRRNSS